MNIIKYLFLFIFACIISTKLFSQQAQFSSNVTTGCKNLNVSFTNHSTGAIISYKWSFGDGSTGSTQANPTHFYQQPGIYTVTLIVFTNSSSDTLVKQNYIRVFAAPTVIFTQNTTSGCVPLTVNFSDLTQVGDTSIASWFWDFGDGSNSTLQNPTHVYNTAGNYNVALFITDKNGCTGEKLIVNHINVITNQIDANFTIDKPLGCSLPHTASISNTSTGTNLNYYWNFGNGDTSTAQNPPSQTYNQFGAFNVQLNITNSIGCKDSIIKTITINEFIGNFSIDTINGCAPFNAQFTDLTIGSTTWSWNFGDGGVATVKNPSHIFANSGQYTVSLIVGNANCSDTISKDINITVFPKPTINFTVNDSTLCEIPKTVNFTYTGSTVNSWNWNFGNSTTSSDQNPQATYSTVNNFTVSLSVIDENNCSNSLTKTNYIKVVLPNAIFNFDNQKGCKPLTVNFSDISTSFENIDYWEWDFGDGSPLSFNQNPNHLYTDTGSFNVSLVISNVEGCSDTVIINNAILVGDHKTVNFSPQDTVGCYKFNVTFSDLSSDVGDEWKWDFGDNSNSALQNPSHTYADTGYFDVSLIVGFHGCYDTLRVDSVVQVWPPVAKLSGNQLIGCEYPHVVTFTDESILADSWEWDFGDTQTFVGQSPPPHTYNNPGFYDVWIFAENTTFNCRDSAMVTVRVSEIIPGFTQDTVRGCKPFVCTFDDTTYVNTSRVGWTWNFSDGGSSISENPVYTFQNSGTYDVQLIVTDQLGCKDSITIIALIEVNQLPNVGFQADLLTGCIPLSVTFTDTTNIVVPITSWNWTFGNGNTSIDTIPTNIYNQRGKYTVTLNIVDENNCTGTATKTEYIKATKPYPNFTYPAVVCNGQSVAFTNTSTPTSTGDLLTYNWEFGDDSVSSATSPSHIYYSLSDTSVQYSILLTAIDENGCDSSVTKNISISIPKAKFTASETNATCPPFYVTMSDNSICNPGNITNWYWDFGDDTPVSTLQNATHSYFSAGVFDVQLIIKNNYGCIDTLKVDSLIKVDGPIGSFTYSVDASTCVPVYTFYAESENSVNSIWIFDDGYTGAGDTINHSYYIPGSYEPVLILQDALGCQDEVEIDNPINVSFPTVDLTLTSGNAICTAANGVASVVASGATPPYNYLWSNNATTANATNLLPGIIRITVTDAVGCPGVDSVEVGQTIKSFNNYFITVSEVCRLSDGIIYANPSLGVLPYRYKWSNSDTLATITNLPANTYILTITDALGCLKIDTAIVNRDLLSFASNISSTDAMCKGKNGTASVNPYNGIGPYIYNWSNGFTSDIIISLDTGKYFVTISDSRGCKSIDSTTIYNTVNNTINASLVSDTNNVLSIVPIVFTSTSTDSIDIVKYTWNIDGNEFIDTIGFQQFQFEYSGVYNINLLIEDKLGCIDSATISVTILDGLEIPNVFSPNGDGINDVFYIHHSGIEEYELQIFNRWGALLFYEKAPKVWWTGYTTSGVEVPTGTYYYVCKAKSVTGTDYEIKGTISLFR